MSSPIPLHWLWNDNAEEYKEHLIEREAGKQCDVWYNIESAESNFIRDTEEHASCPCMRSQAEHDYGRFMPHPRCSKIFRDAYCTVNLGSADCYISAQNIHGQKWDAPETTTYATTYGQVCCYDEEGFLMHTNYQQIYDTPNNDYNPGFPFRAYEFGTPDFTGMFQVPGLSAFHHDILPYFFCCAYSHNNCAKFYWRRPTSGCQNYQAPLIGSIYGSGQLVPLSSDVNLSTVLATITRDCCQCPWHNSP